METNYKPSGSFWQTQRFLVCAVGAISILAAASLSAGQVKTAPGEHWIGTWATAAQSAPAPDSAQTFRNQSLRLIVHTSAGGTKVRIRLSNQFGAGQLVIGGAHIALRAGGADIDPASDRRLTFSGQASAKVEPHAMVISDPVAFDVPALSDLAISLFFPVMASAGTSHYLAKQTNYVSAPDSGDSSGAAKFPAADTLTSWPFLVGVDVAASSHAASIVAFGSSLTDGDGSTDDTNQRWPDVLAERLQKSGDRELSVLNEGIIGNRLLSDHQSPRQAGGPPPLGPAFKERGPQLGQSGLARFDRDVLEQAGVRYVILALGVNDILFPGSFIPATEAVDAKSLIAGNRQLIARAHKKGIRAIGTTIPPFEHASFGDLFKDFYSPEKDKVRQQVNAWVRTSREFDGVIDFDEAVRDPNRPTQILPAFDSGDHLHVNNGGNVAEGKAISLSLFHAH
jgi:lysophospholipase L1-like esterase